MREREKKIKVHLITTFFFANKKKSTEIVDKSFFKITQFVGLKTEVVNYKLSLY